MQLTDYAEKLRDHCAREREIAKWAGRFKKLARRGRSMAAICRDHGLDQSELCHKMAGKRVGAWPRINEVNEALDWEYEQAGLKVLGKKRRCG